MIARIKAFLAPQCSRKHHLRRWCGHGMLVMAVTPNPDAKVEIGGMPAPKKGKPE